MDKINFKDSQTYKNLEKSFEGEAAARVRYGFFSSQAKKDGLVHISNVFAESSDNEKEHAEIWFKLLYGGTVPSTNECLDIAIANEKHEWSEMYAEFAKVAREEAKKYGDEKFEAIAKLFDGVGNVEKFHESRYTDLKNEVLAGKTFTDEEEVYWWCMNCGTFVKGKTAPKLCPVCSHPQAYFIRKTVKICD